MEEKERILDPEACVHCGVCVKHCAFLQKYGIDIGTPDKLNELAYHCFLCNKCTEVCPYGLDGREIILNMRRKQTRDNHDKISEKGYGTLLLEKKNYLFRNYHSAKKTVLFPGCNFPSFFPKTLKMITECLEEQGIGCIYDCCGKPVSELGLQKDERQGLSDLQERLAKQGIEEIITLCPNCYYFLKKHIQTKITSIYEHLDILPVTNKIPIGVQFFPPCPDRESLTWLQQLEPVLSGGSRIVESVQCCGLGGCAAGKEKGLAQDFSEKVKNIENLFTYCATCAGQFTRNGVMITHVLPHLLGTGEGADIGHSFINRAKTKINLTFSFVK